MLGVGLLTALGLSRGSPLAAQVEETVATAPNCEIQMSVGSPRAGATEVPLSLVMSGTAFDVNAEEGTGSPTVVVVYAQSDSSGMEASLEIPISLADATPSTGSPGAFCPSMVVEPESAMPTFEIPMTNVEWRWTAADDPSAYTITFLDNGLFQVRADCNVASGGYVVEGPNLSLVAGPVTLAECPPGSLFDQFLDNLTLVTSFASDSESLVLTLGETGIDMVFAPNDATGAPIQSTIG